MIEEWGWKYYCCHLDAKLKKGGVVSQKDIAKDQGKPISKYERNMLIFDWLHTLGKSSLWNYQLL